MYSSIHKMKFKEGTKYSIVLKKKNVLRAKKPGRLQS